MLKFYEIRKEEITIFFNNFLRDDEKFDGFHWGSIIFLHVVSCYVLVTDSDAITLILAFVLD